MRTSNTQVHNIEIGHNKTAAFHRKHFLLFFLKTSLKDLQ